MLKNRISADLKCPPGFMDPILSQISSKTGKVNKTDSQANEICIFRKGKIGDWRKHLSEEMSLRIDKLVSEKLFYKKPFKYDPSGN